MIAGFKSEGPPPNSIALFGGIFIVCIALAIVSPVSAVAENPRVKLAAILCLTGDIAMNCGAFREGIELAVTEINSRGGFLGKRLEVEMQDSGRDPKSVNTIAQKFAADDEILGVITSTYFEAKYSSPLFEKNNLSSIILWDSTPELEAMGDRTFAIGPWAPSTYETSANYFTQKLGAKRAIIVSQIEEWSQAVGDGFQKTFTASGGEIVDRIDMNRSDSDFRSIISRINAKNPDVVYVPLTQHLELFIKQAKEQGFRGNIVTSDNITSALMKANPRVFDGIYQSMVADPQGPETSALAKKYREHFKRDPELILFVGWAYDAVNMYAQAIQSGATDRKAIAEYIAKITNYPGASGKITMNPGGSSRMMASMFLVKDDVLHPLNP